MVDRLKSGGIRVSVIIPVLNESARIARCIDAILRQTVSVSEIIVVDSGSTDGTLEILARYPRVRIVSIRPEAFNHGEARNIGVRASTGDWIVLTVGDAEAASNAWIEALLDGVVDDEVVAVCGAQIVPHVPQANPVDWFNPAGDPVLQRYQFTTEEDFDSLTPLEKLHACAWDDVSALYRRDILEGIPFRSVMYGEDSLWAMDALRAGHALVYQQRARVNHYHIENADFTFKRTILALAFRYSSFGYSYPDPPLAGSFARTARRVLTAPGLGLGDRLRWMRYNWRNLLAARRATMAFNEAAATGEEAINLLCSRYSATPPVPQKIATRDDLKVDGR